MPDINLAPYDVQAQQLARKRALAQALQQQSMEPIPDPGVPGAKISPVQGFAKLAQALVAAYQNKKLDRQESALSAQKQTQKEQTLGELAKVLMPTDYASQGMDQLPAMQSPNPALQGAMPQGPMVAQPPEDPNAQAARQQALARAMSSNTPEGQMMGQALMGQYGKAQDRKTQQADKLEQMRMAEAAAQQQLRLKQMEMQVLPEGAAGFVNGQVVATNPRPQPPRNIDPNSPEGIAAEIAKSQGGYHPPVTPRNIDPNSPEGIAAQIAISKGSYHAPTGSAEMAPELLAALTETAKTNPDSLKKLSPKDYAQVLARLQQTGGVQPDKVQAMKESMRDQALDTAKWLRENFAAGAVGAKGPTSLGGILSEPLPGTAARDFTDRFNTFKNQIVLPNLDMLKGLGRVTDREFQALQQSMSSLSRSNSEAQFKTELNRVIATLENMKTGTAGAPSAPGLIGPAMQQLINSQKK